MKKSFKKAVHWGPDVVKVFEPTVLKSTTESRGERVNLRSSFVPEVKHSPLQRHRYCKKKHVMGIDRSHSCGKHFRYDKNMAKKKSPRKNTKSSHFVGMTDSNAKRQAQRNSKAKEVRKHRCDKGVKCEAVNGHHFKGEHRSPTAQRSKRERKYPRCCLIISTDKHAKICRCQIGSKAKGILQKCKHTRRIQDTGGGPCDVAQAHRLERHGNLSPSSPYHALKLQKKVKPRRCQ